MEDITRENEIIEVVENNLAQNVAGEETEEEMSNEELISKEFERDQNEIIEEIQRPLIKRFSANYKKDREDEARIISNHIHAINNSSVGEIPFEDVLSYFFSEKIDESDYEVIRKKSFDRKLEEARVKYNKDYKVDYTMQDFLATTLKDYIQ